MIKLKKIIDKDKHIKELKILLNKIQKEREELRKKLKDKYKEFKVIDSNIYYWTTKRNKKYKEQ